MAEEAPLAPQRSNDAENGAGVVIAKVVSEIQMLMIKDRPKILMIKDCPKMLMLEDRPKVR